MRHMSRIIWGGTALVWLCWVGIYLPSKFAHNYDVQLITHSLWQGAGPFLVHLEPLSRDIPAQMLVAILPTALSLTALSLLVAGRRLSSGIILWLIVFTGLPWLYYLYPWILGRYQNVSPHLLFGLPLGRFLDAFSLLPSAVLAIGEIVWPPLAASALALALIGIFRRQLLIEPIRRSFNLSRNASDGWMPTAIAAKLNNKDGLPLGRSGNRILRYPHRDPRKVFVQGHHMVFAASRSGKTIGAVMPGILDHDDGPVFAVDIKGELLAMSRRDREAKGQTVVALNPFGIGEASLIGLNLMDFIRQEWGSEDCAACAVALIREETDGPGGHLMRLARELVGAAIEVVYLNATPEDRHLVTVLDVLTGPGNVSAFQAWAENPGLCGGRPARAVASFQGRDTKERDMVISTIRANLSFAGGDRMQAFLKTSGLKPEHILSGKADIFVVVPLEQVEPQRNFLRLVVALVVNTIIGSKNRKLAKNMLMVLDEFPVLGAMSQIKDLFTVGAGSNITLLTIVQDIARLRDVWGHNAAQSLLSQSATIRIFGLGAGDIDTAKWVSELMPRVSIRREGRSFAASDLMSDRVNYTETERPLMTPDEILTMPSSKGLCIVRNHKPLMVDKIVHHEDAAYKRRADISPYEA